MGENGVSEDVQIDLRKNPDRDPRRVVLKKNKILVVLFGTFNYYIYFSSVIKT